MKVNRSPGGARLLALTASFATLASGCFGGSGDAVPSVEPVATVTAAASPSAPTATPTVRFVEAFPSLPRLERPVALVEIPGQQRMLVALQDGQLLSFAKDAPARELATVLDWRSKTSRDGNEEGLLGLALDPRFEENGFVYVYFSAKPGERRTVLSRLKAAGAGANLKAEPASELVILEVSQPFPNHKGGELTFGPDGMLYLGLGDGGSAGDPRGNGQDIKGNFLGSIIRIDVRNATKEKPYAIPADNPFANVTDGTKRETWAYGLRNPWRFSFDRESGLLWAGDVGQDQREEIDLVEKGKNYGWNVMEGTACFKPSSGCRQEGLTLPVVDYLHNGGACSVTGGFVYRAKAVPALRGWYVYADFCNGQIWAFEASRAAAGTKAAAVELRSKGPSISSFAEDREGELYLLSFDGKIYKIAS